jgi:chromate transporter
MSDVTPETRGAATPAAITPWLIYLTFTKTSLSGFGGTLFWARRKLVEDLKWLTAAEFNETYALGQVIPGANMYNFAILFGYRHAGVRGAVAGALGFFSMPMFVVLSAALFYQHFGTLPLVNKALTGMFAVVVGLTIANAYKMAQGQPRKWRPWAFSLATFAAVGALRWPLVAVMLALAPFAIGLAWRDGSAKAAGNGGAA